MPVGTLAIGDVEIVALRDLLTDAPGTLAEWFPGVPDDRWPGVNDGYPDTVAGSGGWRYHVRCYLVRAPGALILVDTGIGPAGTPISDWLHPPGGSLPDELRGAGVHADQVDLVVTTHMHIDHIGWNATENGPLFSRARYLVHQTEWDAFADEEDPEGRAVRDRLVRGLRDHGMLELVAGERELADGIRLLPTPGHTPGSQSVLISAGEERALLGGDIANHPVQIEHPEWHSGGDLDPALATTTRREWFDRVSREGTVLATAHFPHPFGQIRDGHWEPVSVG